MHSSRARGSRGASLMSVLSPDAKTGSVCDATVAVSTIFVSVSESESEYSPMMNEAVLCSFNSPFGMALSESINK